MLSNIKFLEEKNYVFLFLFFPLTLFIGIAVAEVLATISIFYYLLNSKNKINELKDIKIIFLLFLSFYFAFNALIQINDSLKYSPLFFFRFVLFSLSTAFIFNLINKKNETNFKNALIILIMGPYLLTSLLLGSGLFSDRSREIRETMEYLSTIDIVKKQNIKVDKSGINNIDSNSKIIRISILTPNLGEGVNSINDLNPGELAWFNKSSNKTINNKSYEILYKNDTLEPWSLILKK